MRKALWNLTAFSNSPNQIYLNTKFYWNEKDYFFALILFTAFTLIVNGKGTPGGGVSVCPEADKPADNDGYCVANYDENGKISSYSCLDPQGSQVVKDCKDKIYMINLFI